MKRFLSNDIVVLLARLVLGFTFLVASVDKLAEPNIFATSIMNYKLVSLTTALVLATVLPWVELLCALALLFGISVRGSSLLVGVMLLVFTAAVSSALVRGLDISCGCFTQDPTVGKVAWAKVGENVLLLLLSVFLYFSTSVRFSFERLTRNRRPDTG
jgi:uncharacterized membrane protein YphA (DoxX/SURF4 family)